MPPKTDPWPRPLTPDEDQTIDLCRAIYAADEDMSLERLGDELGWSAPTLSAVFNGTYADGGGRTDRVVKSMRQWIDRVRSDDLAIRRPPFIDLSNAVKIFRFCTECRANREIGYICGEKGVGKTMAVRAFADAHSISTVLVTAVEGYTSVALLQKLAAQFGLGWEGNKMIMFEHLVGEFRRRGHPLLIIDDCDLLGRAIHMARQLHDLADIGIVLSGTEAFLEWLTTRKSGIIGQAHSRISTALVLKSINEEDGERLADFYRVSTTASRKIWDACGRNARRLDHICRRARRLAGDGLIEPAHVDDALKAILPA